MIKKEIKESILEYSNINLDMEEDEIKSSIDLFEQTLIISKEVPELAEIEDNLNKAYASDTFRPSLKLFDFEAFCKLMVYIVDKEFYEKLTKNSNDEKKILSLKKCIKRLNLLDEKTLDELTTKDENGIIIVYPKDDPKHPVNKFRGNKDIDIISSFCLRNELSHESSKMTDYDYFWYYSKLISSFFKICNKYKKNIIRHFLLQNDYAKKSYKKYEEKMNKGYNYIPTKINPKLGNQVFSEIKTENMLITDIHKEKKLRVTKIIGYAGVGKTSLLEYIRYNELKSYIANPGNNRISVIVPMINVSDKNMTIKKLIADTINVNEDTVNMFIQEDKLNLYFDGINEIRIKSANEKTEFLSKLEDFITEYKGEGYIIVTDRDSNDLSILNDFKIIPTLIIKEFSDDEVDNYIEKNVIENRREEVKQIIENHKKNNSSFYQELKKPFILSQFISLVLNGENIPTTDIEITNEVLKSLVNREITEKKSHIAKYIIKALRYVVKKHEVDDTFYIDFDDLNILLNQYKNEVLEDKEAYISHELISLMEKLGILKEAENSLGGVIFTEESYYYALLGDI